MFPAFAYLIHYPPKCLRPSPAPVPNVVHASTVHWLTRETGWRSCLSRWVHCTPRLHSSAIRSGRSARFTLVSTRLALFSAHMSASRRLRERLGLGLRAASKSNLSDTAWESATCCNRPLTQVDRYKPGSLETSSETNTVVATMLIY